MAANGYWLVKDTNTGHAAVIKASSPSPSTTPVISDAFKKAIGAGKGDYFTSYYLTSDPNKIQDRLYAAMGALQLSIDTIPQGDGNWWKDQLKNGIKGLNFDVLTPIGVNPNTYQQGTSNIGNTAKNVVGAFSLSALFGSQSLWAGVGMVLAGAVLILIGIMNLAGVDAGGLGHAAARVTTP